jgi:uncharacterized protein (TIGR02246 family)
MRNARLTFVLMAAVCTGFLFSEARAADSRAADAAAIKSADEAWAKAAEAKDLDKCVAPYLDDAVIFSPGAPAVIGKENIRKFFSGMIAGPRMQFGFTDVKIDVAQSGDIAMDRGVVTATVIDKDGKSTTSKSDYVLVWKKQADGKWKVAADTSANEK